MTESERERNVQISRQNISYYDKIAEKYDAILNDDVNNKIIRETVADRFSSLVKNGWVLDFGGGTGRDLSWLINHQYQILFCEPSVGMREIAINRISNEFPGAKITFFDDDKSDFRNWNDIFPFERKVDAVIANFAVINCIPDIQLLFDKLALSLKPGGTVLALLLDNSFLKRLRSNLKGTIKSFFTGNPVSIFINYNDRQQLVYIHTTMKIRKAMKNKFDFIHIERLKQFGFCLIHLRRK
ncbi:MAG TPA: class I SAM-dependent methyltransferase [Puia sp.]|nr:class I SAM-dependent methyltransferase [Puia sp.]